MNVIPFPTRPEAAWSIIARDLDATLARIDAATDTLIALRDNLRRTGPSSPAKPGVANGSRQRNPPGEAHPSQSPDRSDPSPGGATPLPLAGRGWGRGSAP